MSCYYNSTVPSSPPQNVTITSINPGSLIVSWEPPIEIDHNGPIISYIIQYTRVKSSDTEMVTVNGQTTRIVISGLDGSADYTVAVAVMNINGTGPSSSLVVGSSGESGE